MTYPALWADASPTPVAAARARRGALAWHTGMAAEDSVLRDYERRGRTMARRRWRGKGGEIDLILRDGEAIIFVEVKQARTFDGAAERLSRRQMDRICMAAQEYLVHEPRGLLTDIRFDLALVNGQGGVRIIENAFGEN